MELAGLIVLTLWSFASASPYGYGARSGAVAKAEASAGAGDFGLPVIPLAVPGSGGYSGSFSKSSSSSYASSSASSSSSSFSYSGSGTNVVPGFGHGFEGPGCSGGCQHGGKTDNGLNGQGLNQNIGSHVNNYAGASAVAGSGAFAAPSNAPCKDSSCYGTSDSKCSSGKCNAAGNGNNNDATSSGSSMAESENESNDFAVGTVNKPHFSSPELNARPYNDNKPKSNSEKSSSERSDTKIDSENTNDCNSPNCESVVPLTPGRNYNNFINNQPDKKASIQEQACATHDCNSDSNGKLPTSYNVPILGNQHQPNINVAKTCEFGNCQESSNNFPSNQNVHQPSHTLQVPTEQSGPIPCNTKDCSTPPNHQVKPVVPAKNDVNIHTDGIQLSYQPSGPPSIGLNPSYNPNGPENFNNPPQPTPVPDKNPSYQKFPSEGSYITSQPTGPKLQVTQEPYDRAVAGASPHYSSKAPGFQTNPSVPSNFEGPYQPNRENQHNNPQKPADYEINPSYQSKQPAGNIPSFQPSGIFPGPNVMPNQPLHSNPHPSYPTGSVPGANIYPLHQHSGPPGVHNKPHYQSPLESDFNPIQYQPNRKTDGPSSPIGGPSCNSGNCKYPTENPVNTDNTQIGQNYYPCSFGKCLKPSNSLDSTKPNVLPGVPKPYHPPVTTNNNFASPGNSAGCTSPNCYPTEHVTAPGHSGPILKPGSIVLNQPSESDSEVLLSNKGNQIYTGGFNGPTGILTTNNKNKPGVDGIFLNPSHDNGHHDAPHLQSVPNPSTPSPHLSLPNLSHHVPVGIGEKPLSNNNLKPVTPVKQHDDKNDHKPQYTGGFGGPAGLLKPNEFTIPHNSPKSPCPSGTCGPNSNQLGAAAGHAVSNAAAIADAKAVSYSGSFGGPPGLLKPFDQGKLDTNGQRKDLGIAQNNYNNNGQPHNFGGITSGAQANAMASASATAGSYGTGGCSACSSGSGQDVGHSSSLGNAASNTEGSNLANAAASAKSVASGYAQGRSVATASAHASAGASVKGGYAWR
ncbi:unnamed protein product [Leptosia nina]|uniref:Uncharacterized protein n=1 Tax=Leptosia nina TaxID=320188 RepID=A0AAV1IV63_9NEOP